MFKKIENLMNERGISLHKLATETGIAYSTLSSFKHKKSTLKADKLQKVADYFGVTLEYLMKGEDAEIKYFTNEETARLVQEAFEDPDTRILLSAKKDLSPNDFQIVLDLVRSLKNK